MYFSTLLMNPFLSGPVRSPLSSCASGSGIVTSAQPETMVHIPCRCSLSRGLGWSWGQVFDLLPPPRWHLGEPSACFGRNTTGTFSQSSSWIVPGNLPLQELLFLSALSHLQGPVQIPSCSHSAAPKGGPGWCCRVCCALRTHEPVPFSSTDWGAGCGTGRDRNS